MPVEVVKPDEGATGWSDTWMINSKTKHPTAPTSSSTTSCRRRSTSRSPSTSARRPGNSKSCALATNPDHCDIFHAEDDRLLEGRLVLDHARGEVPRRPHRRQVHGLRRLGRGLDRDQGQADLDRGLAAGAPPPAGTPIAADPMTRTTTGRLAAAVHRPPAARRVAPRAPATAPRGCCSRRPLGLAGRRLPRVAGRSCSSTRSGRATPSPGRRSTSRRSRTSPELLEDPYPAITLRTVGMAAARHRDLRRARVPDRLLHGPRASPRVRGLLVVASSCRCGRATSSRSTRGG